MIRLTEPQKSLVPASRWRELSRTHAETPTSRAVSPANQSARVSRDAKRLLRSGHEPHARTPPSNGPGVGQPNERYETLEYGLLITFVLEKPFISAIVLSSPYTDTERVEDEAVRKLHVHVRGVPAARANRSLRTNGGSR